MLFPTDRHRHAIFGQTGSGKTQFAIWCLSRRSYQRMPWVIIDFKHDESIADIPGLIEIRLDKPPPKQPGIYVVRPRPEIDDKFMDALLWEIWKRGKTGIFLDEGYMLGRLNKAYRAILTQGRSKLIPVITLSQRPAWISPFILSESEFITAFFLASPADRDRCAEWMAGADPYSLPKFHSWHWSVPDRRLQFLRPVPKLGEILDRFEPVKRWRDLL
jgi:hypothetical protein